MYKLSPDTQQEYETRGIINLDKAQATLPEIVAALNDMYTGPLTAEFHHLRVGMRKNTCISWINISSLLALSEVIICAFSLQTEEEKEWFATNFEQVQRDTVPDAEKVTMAELMLKSQVQLQ